MTFDFLSVFMFLTSILGLIISSILLFFSRSGNYNKFLLSISLFSYSWYCLLAVIFYSKAILQVPYLFRTSAPCIYLVVPASYLYVRSTLYGETRPRKQDWIHLTPFVIILLELIPFYLKDSASKIRDINYYFVHKEELVYMREGLFEKHVHLISRVLLALVYFYLQLKIIRNFLIMTPPRVKAKYRILLNWLKLYTFLFIATFILLLLTNVLNLYLTKPRDIFNIIISLHLLIVSFVLLFKPALLYSLNKDQAVVSKKMRRSENKPEVAIRERPDIEDLLKNQQCYLARGYSLPVMARELNISVPVLSAIINKEYHMTFTDLINKYRVEYIIHHMKEGKMTNYTFEGLALEAGFNSRTTFYRAFLKVTGQTPGSYLKNTP